MIEVVIPAYNAGPFLRETLESVAAQALRPARVTVVDDSSTDDTVAVAEACAAALRDRIAIRILRNPGPRGPSAARNLAIRAEGPEFVALLDADDLLAPSHHALLLAAISAAPDLVLAYADHTVFGPSGTIQESGLAHSGVASLAAETIAPGVFTLGEGSFRALLRTGIFGTSACLFRRSAALAAGLFDEAMMHGEDTDLFLRMSLAGRFAFRREVVAHKRVHGSNLTHERNALMFCRGTVRSLTRLAAEDRAGRAALSAPQRAALLEAIPPALRGHLYAASRAGLGAYRDAAGMAARAGHARLAAAPRHLLRLAKHSLLHAARRGH
ncbi:Glycosyl transferase family 2 [Roseomonas rosea]|uniref:Glycosyl transferase family 2 n=1 Tax=Muricoccus roseus TaxID=198092 RepID=A0A1M6NAM3_9PROT|nr:glycosyltransferase family A protein [Roseomonas rosea]SHJ92769.1 Glycosyl transferase family 2 [Roseomonas rosea]